MIESMKNARTTGGRELLEELTKEFESICSDGDIIYLGTPQTSESVYNNLESRGYKIRIWTGRYPTDEQRPSYGDHLAPMLDKDVKLNSSLKTGGGLAGNLGQPTCPEMFSNDTLIDKELSQGSAKFQLQYMLNTRLSDSDRFPLKCSNLVIADFNTLNAPICPVWSQDPDNFAKELPRATNRPDDKLYWAVKRPYEYKEFERSVMYIDGAGGGSNGDENAYVVIKLIGSYIYIVAWGGVKGGYDEELSLMPLVRIAKEHNVKTVYIEKNYGNGAHMSMLRPLFNKHFPVTLEEEWGTGQKELRIIDTIEPILSRHQLIISPSVIRNDLMSIKAYPREVQLCYSGMYQLCMISRDRNCLRHDDRLDALSGAIRMVSESIDFDTQMVLDRKKKRDHEDWIKAWNDPQARLATLGLSYSGTATRSGRNRF